jgi:hypothetical protein
MGRLFARYLSLFLCLTLVLQTLTGCSGSGGSGYVMTGGSNVNDSFITDTYINEAFITEEQLTETYIIEHLRYEEGLYEYTIDEQTIGQAIVVELVVGENSKEEILAMFPKELDEYDIEWGKVIGKFTVGTTIIVAVGVVNSYLRTKGIEPTFFMMCSTTKVKMESLAGGAIAATLNVAINAAMKGELPKAAVKKYTVEGFADGYMWGAISAVLKVSGENFKRLKSLKLAIGSNVTVNAAGQVFDDTGKLIGKAFYNKNGIFHLLDEATKTVKFFDKKGKQIVDAAILVSYGLKNGQLPANSILRLAAEGTENVLLHYTDDAGQIYRVGKELLPNTTYTLKGYKYTTDSLGRPVRVVFDNLRLKPEGRASLKIKDTLDDIAKGFGRDGLDDRGHLMGDQFDGDNSLANIVAMDRTVNQQTIKAIEMQWAKTLQSGGKVSGNIEITYSVSTYRPDSFKYTYDMGAGLIEEIISNIL